MKEKGTMITCNRCRKQLFVGNGYGVDVPEQLSRMGWTSMVKDADLCKECSERYQSMLQQFYENDPKELHHMETLDYLQSHCKKQIESYRKHIQDYVGENPPHLLQAKLEVYDEILEELQP